MSHTGVSSSGYVISVSSAFLLSFVISLFRTRSLPANLSNWRVLCTALLTAALANDSSSHCPVKWRTFIYDSPSAEIFILFDFNVHNEYWLRSSKTDPQIAQCHYRKKVEKNCEMDFDYAKL